MSGEGKGVRCSICQDTESGPFIITPCGHEFHIICLKKNYESGVFQQLLSEVTKLCPVCRKEIPISFIEKLSLSPENIREAFGQIQYNYNLSKKTDEDKKIGVKSLKTLKKEWATDLQKEENKPILDRINIFISKHQHKGGRKTKKRRKKKRRKSKIRRRRKRKTRRKRK